MSNSRIRTINLLPDIFQTPVNAEFLSATLDQISNPPITNKIQGYIGNKFGNGVDATDFYVTEPNKIRTDYQLEPGVVFLKDGESKAKDFISYPGITDALKLEGAYTDNNSTLFESQFYSWDSFTDLDKLINFNQYYWLPDGLPAVTVSTASIFATNEYVVTDLPNSYNIREISSSAGSFNPSLTLLRGGTYQFIVDQDSQFFIQAEPGTSGVSAIRPNLSTRQVLGVDNNGASQGIVTFTVPPRNAQDDFVFPGNISVDVVSNQLFETLNGRRLADINDIDTVTSLNGLRVMFHDTPDFSEIGYVSTFYDETSYGNNAGGIFSTPQTLLVSSSNTSEFTVSAGTTDNLVIGQIVTFDNPVFGGIDANQVYVVFAITSSTTFEIAATLDASFPVTLIPDSGSMQVNINQGLLEEGFETQVSQNFYRIQYIGDPNDPVLRLVPDGLIPNEQNISVRFGKQFIGRNFFKNQFGVTTAIPLLTAPLDQLFYQDGTSSNKVGIINLVESNTSNTLDVERDILGKKNFTDTNGIVFTNGLKVSFDGDIVPVSFLQGQYYVEGVGSAIELIPVSSLVSPEGFTQSSPVPWDTTAYDVGNFDFNLFIPVKQDYITIARNAINKNAWSRSNRWFHVDVIRATAEYNNNPDIVTFNTNPAGKAKRPIIEFHPNLRLFNSGTEGKEPVDFFDTRTTDALSNVAGQEFYHPDVEVFTHSSATIAAVTDGRSTTISIDSSDITGLFRVGMIVKDSANVLPNNTTITDIQETNNTIVLTVGWDESVGDLTFSQVSDVEVIGSVITLNNYAVFSGSRIVFAADSDPNVRNKIYVVKFSTVENSSAPIITLAEADNGEVLVDNQIIVLRGFSKEGTSNYYTGNEWKLAQQKTNVNQAPMFDVFGDNGVSYSDDSVFNGTSFAGSTLFAYGRGFGSDDPILGFPIKFSSIDNTGDISFNITFNSDMFDYNDSVSPITKNISNGYVLNYTTRTDFTRELGWKTAIAHSTQYQIFSFDYETSQSASFICDVAMRDTTSEPSWPSVKVFINNVWQPPESYTVSVDGDSTLVSLHTEPNENTVVQVLLLSDQVSKKAHYQIPINLNSNPFNADLTTVNVGDIRNHYQDIFINLPNASGEITGSNNLRDLGPIAKYGTKIIKNSASLSLPGAFLRKNDHNIFDALLFNSREYIKFKNLIVNTIDNTDYEQRQSPSVILDAALDQITAPKDQNQSFFWSDMLPSRSPLRQNTYVFNNDLDTSVYPLTRVYDFEKANYYSVLVYLQRNVNGINTERLLTINNDYFVSEESPSLRVVTDLLAGDKIVIKEFNQTYGSYVPNTPTKLGLYPATEPNVVLDSNYSSPVYFIKGHDGSYTKLYGNYSPADDLLTDFRDQALLEFEKRIYNNLKLKGADVVNKYDVVPGFFRNVGYSWNEFLEIYSSSFLNWIGQNRLDYKTQFFNKSDKNTYNYSSSANKLDNTPFDQGYWRGIYEFFYDTSVPNTSPWEMLGLSKEPTWWEERYGPSPYTSDNKILWDDIESGFIWNDGDSFVVANLARPGLSKIIPVDTNGELRDIFDSLAGNFNTKSFQRDWKVGDISPVEFSYRRSSSYPFDLVRIFALTKPANFFNLAVDIDNYRYNKEFDQYLVNDKTYLKLSDVEIYGTGKPKTSYINWIVDFEKQLGIAATQQITDLLKNLDVRLVYRLAGYSDKTLLKFFVEKGTPNSSNASLLIPDESYSVLLYDNQPFTNLIFSSVIVQQVLGGFQIFGNSQTTPYFNVLDPLRSGKIDNISVENLSVKVSTQYQDRERLVPYGTKFFSVQEVAQFLMSYAAWLESKGMIFDQVENGAEINWRSMVAELLYWVQSGWEIGSIIALNPSATNLKIDKENSIVQPLTIQQTNFILNQNLFPINLQTLCVTREETKFEVSTLNQGDTMAYAQFNLSNFEHGVVFDNKTIFNDIIYNLTTGLRQNRLTVRGTKTAEWNGTVNAFGFVFNQDNIEEWAREYKYTKGEIVLYKNKYWTSLKIIQPAAVFNEDEWKQIDYENIQIGLLPNAATRAFESTLYYNVNKSNLEKDADILSYSLIGYRPRDYLEIADLTDVTQVNVYKNLVKNKGTRTAVDSFKGALLPQGRIDYELYENWAIKTGEFGGVLNDNFVEFKLAQKSLVSNPSIVSLTQGKFTSGSHQEIPLYSLFNFGRAIDSPDILSTTTDTSVLDVYSDAGFVNFNDVKMASYFYSGLSNAVDSDGAAVQIQDFYVGDFLWLANFKDQWGVFSWKSEGRILQVDNNTNDTTTVTFDKPHTLSRLDPLAIVNFAPEIDGYYVVTNVIDSFRVVINLTLANTSEPIQGLGIGLSYTPHRVQKPSDIANLNLLESEFTKNIAWVDDDQDGEWGVYKKSINYSHLDNLVRNESSKFGSALAYGDRLGYLFSDPDQGRVYRYSFRKDQFQPHPQTFLTGGPSFGTAISYSNNVYAISEPKDNGTGEVYLYVINDSIVSDRLVDYQLPIEAPAGVTGEWGTQLALSNDTRWLYVSASDDNKVFVYRQQNIILTAEFLKEGKSYRILEAGNTDWETNFDAVESKKGIHFIATRDGETGDGNGIAMQVNYDLVEVIDGRGFSNEDDRFSSALSTDRHGETVAIGAPNKNFNDSITNWGAVYVYNRTVQNLESRFLSSPNRIQSFDLAWQPSLTTVNVVATGSNSIDNSIELGDVSEINTGDPIIFTGSGLIGTSINSNIVYFVHNINGNNIQIKTARSSNEIESITSVATITDAIASVQTSPLYVSVNGIDVADNNYAVVGNKLFYTGILRPGDIINISGSKFSKINTFNSAFTDRTNIQYGTSTAISKFGNELLVGAPFEIDIDNTEGAVYRYTNGSSSYGIVVGTEPCNVTTSRKLLINGFLVNLSPGNAESISKQINSTKLPNVNASFTEDNQLIIQTVDLALTRINSKLQVTSYEPAVLREIGISVFTETQIIKSPHTKGRTRFGNTIKFNEFGSVVISAPVGTRHSATTFDFSDNLVLDDDTLFDNNATKFTDTLEGAGAVYIFDYLDNFNESIFTPGKFVYAQSVNSRDLSPGLEPNYGLALEFVENRVIIGSPNANPLTKGGEITVYVNESHVRNWNIFRKSAPIVDVNKIQNLQIFSAETNDTLVNLDYIDPLQGKLLGAVRQNIDYISNVDPAGYNSNSDIASQFGLIWGREFVGEIWFDTTNVRWLNYHQNDPSYNAKYWGSVFPGSSVAVYTWVESNNPPNEYRGPGTPFNINLFTVGNKIDASDIIVPKYYFWVRNTNKVVRGNQEKTLADSILASYIRNPKKSGIPYATTLLPNTVALYNVFEFLNDTDSVLHVGFANGTFSDESHEQFSLIRENFSEDFLLGVPPIGTAKPPGGLYEKLLDSLSGVDNTGKNVPDPFLPKSKQSGILSRPRQSFFFKRLEALKNYLLYANSILKQFPIVESKPNSTFLFSSGDFFDTAKYWEFIDWRAPGFDDSTKSSIQVPRFTDLVTLEVSEGTIVTVEQNGAGKYEVYRYENNDTWTRIGLESGTIRFKSTLFDFSKAKVGFDGTFFDADTFDEFPSEETRNIVRALTEQVFIDDLIIHKNKSLILLFEYIQSEASESQNFLPWLNKTSLADVKHTIRELKPIDVFKTDNQEFLEGYIKEVKPYHVVIKEFLFNYTGDEVFDGNVTDFDLPAKFNTSQQRFSTPQLVNEEANSCLGISDQHLSTSSIWGEPEYQDWFENTGVAITGERDHEITTLVSYLEIRSKSIVVDNAQGFPINGVIKIGNEEISYSNVDRATNTISGLSRGINQTETVDHLPGDKIFIDLPAVLVLDGGRGYTEPPRVTAVIDLTKYPAPTKPAELEVVMSLDSVIQVNVIDPGKGYAVLPEIRIDPANVITFSNSEINELAHTIKLFGIQLLTGDLVLYQTQTTGSGVGKLADNQWYYVNVLETSPSVIVALYASFFDAVNDRDRIKIAKSSTDGVFVLQTGAKASAVTTAAPIRQNTSVIKFDRTSYRSRITDWRAGAYYGSFFSGSLFNSAKISSSSIQLKSTQPPIDFITASARGATFEIVEIENERNIEFSSFIRFIEKTISGNNAIRLIPQDNNSAQELDPNGSGTTIGFFTGMPIKFEGAVAGGLLENQTYFVAEVLDETDFTVSETENGNELTLTDATISAQGLRCFTGSTNDLAIVKVNYPDILKVTNTAALTNAITVPMSQIGTGGTLRFYMGLPVYFTGDVFGNVVENVNYFVTTVIDSQTFTISEEDNAVTSIVEETVQTTNIVKISSSAGFAVKDPIIFNTMTDEDGNSLTEFGNIESGKTYFVRQVLGEKEITISEIVNGSVLSLNNQKGSALLTNQKDTVQLSNGTGSMTLNVSLPVSPGQINGQLFTFYKTSQQFADIVPALNDVSNLIERKVSATISGVDKIALDPEGLGTDNMYVNLPIQFNTVIGEGGTEAGIDPNETYFVTEFSGEEIEDPNDPEKTIIRPRITVEVDQILAGDIILCNSTESLYENMRIIFAGSGIGGVIIGQPFFVKEIIDSQRFTISETFGGPVKELSASTGFMLGTGDAYIKVSDTLGGATFDDFVTESVNPAADPGVILTQQPDTASLELAISSIFGGYRAIVVSAGSGFAIDNDIKISGSLLGGTSPSNDVILTVDRVNETGGIVSLIASGTVSQIPEKYYLKVRSSTELEVYEDGLLSIPVSGIGFGYEGFITADVLETQESTNLITLSNVNNFVLNDAVVFTGNVTGNLDLGKTYYIISIDPIDSTIQVSEIPSGTAVTLDTAVALQDYTIAKVGDFAFLPEPFFFNQSIVKFNNRVYVCIISNDDEEFVFGKWELLNSGDRRLNALDRVEGYYQPTANMPGLDMTQLFEGVSYPNAVYLGNPFAPADQLVEDIILKPQSFYPADLDVTSVVWDGSNYLASINALDFSAVAGSSTGDTWSVAKIANEDVQLSDIVYENDIYVITSLNTATPIFKSVDGIVWSTDLFFNPINSVSSNTIPYDMTPLAAANLSLNAVTFGDSLWVAVGSGIIRSNDAQVWKEELVVGDATDITLHGVAHVSIPTFTGFIAVGEGKRTDFSTGITQLVNTNVIFYSADGEFWIGVPSITPNGLYGVASNDEVIVAVGENGAIYYSLNGDNWLGVTEQTVTSFGISSNIINVSNTAGLEVNDIVRITNTFGGLELDTDYFVIEIISPTQLKVSETLGGSEADLIDSPIAAQTRLVIQDPNDPESNTLRDVINANDIWIAVGDNGTIKTSSDYLTWTLQTSGVSENLSKVIYNPDANAFIAVGENNTILISSDGVNWEVSNLFSVAPAMFNIKGDAFDQGYGPEELLPGVVTDHLQLTVTTRPGTNWPVVEYSHTGYNVVSIELIPEFENQVEYSYDGVVQYPAQLSVQVIDPNTELGTTLSPELYTVDWLNKTISLNSPLVLFPEREILRVDVYEVGNGNQLEKSSTDYNPIRLQEISQFNEIYLTSNYSASQSNGGGVVKPGTFVIAIEATETLEEANRIVVSDISEFTIDASIKFLGDTFGGIIENQTYFVKTISSITNTITVSAVFNQLTGTAGPTEILTNATGSMQVSVQSGAGLSWTPPIVYRNGLKLVSGKTNIAFRSKSDTNTIVTSSTAGMVVGNRIVFCANCPFGNSGIVPMTTYFIHSIVDNNTSEFRISDTEGGPALELLDATGSSRFITNDYSFGIQPNGILAKLMFASNELTNASDYIVYSVFGESGPEQFGYTIPETQLFIGDGSNSTFNLVNNVTLNNPENAVVEINGVRQTTSRYNIDPNAETITFTSPPDNEADILVTTFNDTRRQYLTTRFGITGSPGSAFTSFEATATSNTVGTFDQGSLTTAGDFEIGVTYTIETTGDTDFTLIGAADSDPGTVFTATGEGTGTGTASFPPLITYDENLNIVTIDPSTADLNINDTVIFSGTEFGGLVAGREYYIVQIISSNEIVLSEEVGGTSIQLTNDTGTMTASANGITVASIIAIDNAIQPLLASSRATNTVGSTNLITAISTANFIVGQPVQFKGIGFGNIETDGTVYFIRSIENATEFTIEDENGDIIDLITATGNIIIEVGGKPAVRVTTAEPHLFDENSLIRIDGVLGSAQLNNNVYYAKVIDSVRFDLYVDEYSPAVNAVNNPVTAVSSYISDGYAWRSGTFYLQDAVASETKFSDDIEVLTPSESGGVYDIINIPFNYGILSVFNDTEDATIDPINYQLDGNILKINDGAFINANDVLTITLIVNSFQVDSVDNLIIGTPVYFTEFGAQPGNTLLGGVEQGTEYFIKDISIDNNINTFSISETQFGDVLTLTSGTGLINVAQWEQVNVDRLWVTVNGLRVLSSNLRINSDGELSILATIAPGDEVIVTSMINFASPNKLKYINLVDASDNADVYRANADGRTWVEETAYELATEIKLQDVTNVTNLVFDNVVVPAIDNNVYSVAITADKRILSGVDIINNTTGESIPKNKFTVEIVNTLPVVQIQSGSHINEGDDLTIKSLEGNTVIINGEQIRFASVDFETNTLGHLQRGANGTATRPIIDKYSVVFSLLSRKKLPEAFYTETWNSSVFNKELGDPLQISQTIPARFFRSPF